MARFLPEVPVRTREPFVTVDPDLEPGTYRFRLVVTDDRGNRSEPAFVDVTVARRTRPQGDARPAPG